MPPASADCGSHGKLLRLRVKRVSLTRFTCDTGSSVAESRTYVGVRRRCPMRAALHSVVLLVLAASGGLFGAPGCGSDEDGSSGGGAGRRGVTAGGGGQGALGRGGNLGAPSGDASARGSGGSSGGVGGGGSGGAAAGSAGTSGTAGTDGGLDAAGNAGASGSGGADAGGGAGAAGRAGAGGADAAACVGDWRAGDYPPGIMQEMYLEISNVVGQQGLARQYKVHLPPSYDCSVPAPVVFCLHGLSQTPVMFCVNGSGYPGGAGMHTKSDEAGFILVMPLGYGNSWNGAGC